MSDRLPYEDQLAKNWDELPLPDENLAWEDMKRRLEDDDDKGIIPFWLRGCGGCALLLLVLVGTGWWWYTSSGNENKKEPGINQQQKVAENKEEEKKKNAAPAIGKPGRSETADKSPTHEENFNDTIPGHDTTEKEKIEKKDDHGVLLTGTKQAIAKDEMEHLPSKRIGLRAANKETKRKQVTIKSHTGVATRVSSSKEAATNQDKQVKKDNAGLMQAASGTKIINTNPADTLKTKLIESSIVDTTRKSLKDSAVKNLVVEMIKDKNPGKDSAKPRSVSFSAGIALHQLVPVDGQKLTPYNSQGRKGSLADYIPSLFFRMYRNDKWFLQSEFRYGAPQYTREIVYQQETKRDTFNTVNTTTSARLKKTFYHQLPVSFNYFVLPNLSVGGGLVWNKFKGAISEQDVIQRTVSTGIDTVLSKGVILNNKRADSNFTRSYFQALIETQYRWKRFSFGARYSFGLEPYLKFTLPGGAQQKERNRSLQVFIRYELWKSKTKSLKDKKR